MDGPTARTPSLARELDETLSRDLAPLFAEQAHRLEEQRRLRIHADARRTAARAAPREPSASVSLLLGVCGGLLLATWSAGRSGLTGWSDAKDTGWWR